MFENSCEVENNVSSLSSLFDEGLKLFNNLEQHDEPTNSLDVQVSIISEKFSFSLVFDHCNCDICSR